MKIKKVLIEGIALSAAFLIFVTPTFASKIDPSKVTGSSDGKGATSYGHIKVTPGDETTGPTDPIEPSEPGGETGNKGSLTIDNVSPLEFDTHQLSGGAVEYTTTTQNPNVQVTDIRGNPYDCQRKYRYGNMGR